MLKAYLENIKDISTNDKEHTHRTALQNLLQAIKIIKTSKIKSLSNKNQITTKKVEVLRIF